MTKGDGEFDDDDEMIQNVNHMVGYIEDDDAMRRGSSF